MSPSVSRAEPGAGRLTRRAFLRLAAGAGALGMGGALAACGALAPATPTPTPQAETTITLWNWIDDALADVVKGFEQANPAITVKLERMQYGDAHGRLARALEAGEGAPDVFITERGRIADMRAAPGLADLSAAPFDAAQLKDDVLPWAWDLAFSEGRLFAMPWNVGVGVAWYRADVLEAAGLPSDPQAVREQAATWDGWVALDEALRRKGKASLIPESLRLFSVAVEQQGYGWVDGAGRLLVEEKGTPAAELLASLHERGVPPDLAGGEFGRQMVEGSYAGMVDASWAMYFVLQDFQQTAGKWRVARAPGGDFAPGATFALIPQQSRQQEAAWTFVRYLCATPEGQNAAFSAAGAVPAYMPAWRDPAYDQPVALFGGQPAYRLMTEAAGALPAPTLSRLDSRIDQIVGRYAQDVAEGDAAPKEAMADAAASVRKQIPDLAQG